MKNFKLCLALGLMITLPEVGFSKDSSQPASTQPAAAEPTASKTHRIELKFFEKGSGIPLKRVEVSAGSTKLFSKPDGSLFLSITKDSDGSITCSKKGYESRTITAEMLLEKAELKVFLFPSVNSDDVIVIRGEKRTNISKKTISITEAKKIAPNNDPGQIVKIMPGVQTQNFGGQVVIRGSGPSDSRYYIDDLDVPFLYHSIGELTVIPAPIISEVEFDSGGFSAQYGDATGGVIRVVTKTDIPKRERFEFTSNIPIYSGVFYEKPLTENSYMSVGFRRSYFDLFVQKALDAAAEESGSDSTVLSPIFSDAHIRHVKKDENGHLKLSVIASRDALAATFPSDFSENETGTSEFQIDSKFVILGAEKEMKLSKEWRIKTTPQTRYNTVDNNFAGNLIDIKTCMFRAPTEFTKRISKDEDFYVGFDPEYYRTRVDIFSIIPNFEDPTFDFEDAPKERIEQQVFFSRFASWVEGDKVFGKYKFTAGLRNYYNSQTEKFQFDPRLRVVYKADKVHSVKLAAGQYSKHPLAQESGEEAGNSDLNYEQSQHKIIGVESKWSDAWTTDFQLFHKSTGQVINQSAGSYYENNGEQRSYGAEAFIRRNLTSRFFGWFSYTYSINQERSTSATSWRSTTYDQTHVVNLASSYRLTNVWELGLRYKYNTGNTYTPIKRAVYNANLDKYQPRIDPNDTNAARYANLSSMSLYATKDFLYDTWKLKLKFGLESFWPEEQVFGVSYNYDYTKTYTQAAPKAIPFIELSGVL